MKLLLVVALGATSIAAQESKITTLLTRDLTGVPSKEGTMLTVEYAPGASGGVHHHNADVFVYVLEGSVVMQVEGGKQVTLGPGETFHETPGDTHVVGRNASTVKPAKFLVFMVKEKGAPVAVPGRKEPAR